MSSISTKPVCPARAPAEPSAMSDRRFLSSLKGFREDRNLELASKLTRIRLSNVIPIAAEIPRMSCQG